MCDYKKQKVMNEQFEFLNEHPAFCGDVFGDFMSSQCFYTTQVDENGISGGSCCDMHVLDRNHPRAKLFIDKFKKTYKNRNVSEDKQRIYVTYKQLYGKRWEYHHVNYSFDVTFFKYQPIEEGENKKMMHYNPINYERFSGFIITRPSFEDLVIDTAKKVKERFGNFSKSDFITKQESKQIDKNISKFIKQIGQNKQIEFGEDIANVSIVNLRWFDWFRKTDWYKKNWGESNG